MVMGQWRWLQGEEEKKHRYVCFFGRSKDFDRQIDFSLIESSMLLPMSELSYGLITKLLDFDFRSRACSLFKLLKEQKRVDFQ